MGKHERFKDYLYKELKNPEYAKQYFETALEDYLETSDKTEFLTAIRDIVDAYGGPTKVCKGTGINRQTLYKALAEDGNPTIETLYHIMSCINDKGDRPQL